MKITQKIESALQSRLMWIATPIAAWGSCFVAFHLNYKLAYLYVFIGSFIPLVISCCFQKKKRTISLIGLMIFIIISALFVDDDLYVWMIFIVAPPALFHGVGLGHLVNRMNILLPYILYCGLFGFIIMFIKKISVNLRATFFFLFILSFLFSLKGCKPYFDDALDLSGMARESIESQIPIE